MKKRTINLNHTCAFISCIMLFLPCILSIVSGYIIVNSLVLLMYWVMIFILGFASLQSCGEFKLKYHQIRWLAIWMILFTFSFLNRNGDLAEGSLVPSFYFLAIILFSALIVMSDRFDEKCLLCAVMVLLMIQLAAGYYFLKFPDQLLALQDLLVTSEDEIWVSKFTFQISSGAFMGLVSHYSTSGMYMALGTIITGGLLLAGKAKSGRIRVWNLILFALFFAALILTQKRGHLLFGIAALIMMYFVGYIRGNIKTRLRQFAGIIVICIVLLAVVLQIPAFSDTISRFAAGASSASLNDLSSDRIDELWLPALQEFLEHPLFGMGWRQFKYAHPMSNGVNNDCHNIYIQLLCENGITGFILFLSVMFCTYRKTWKILKREKNNPASTCYRQMMFSFGYQTFFLLYGLTGNPLYDMPCYFPYILACAMTYKYCGDRAYLMETLSRKGRASGQRNINKGLVL